MATAYKESKVGATDLLKASEGAGYEVGHFARYGRFVPFSQAEKRIENTSTKGFLFNIPYDLGAKSGRQLAKGGGSVIANTIPFTGTFGHLFAHPRENIFDKSSDIAFGVLDLTGIGDVAQAFKKPVEEGVDVIGNTLAKRITGIPHIEPPRFPIIRTPLPILHLPHIDINLPEKESPVSCLDSTECKCKTHGDEESLEPKIEGIIGHAVSDITASYLLPLILEMKEGDISLNHNIFFPLSSTLLVE